MDLENQAPLFVALDPLYHGLPEGAEKLRLRLAGLETPLLPALVNRLARAVAAFHAVRAELGPVLVEGVCRLLSEAPAARRERCLEDYLEAVTEAGRITLLLAQAVAEKMVPVCAAEKPALYHRTMALFRDLGPWGPYPWGQVANGLLSVLEVGGAETAGLYVDMIAAALSQGIAEKKLIRLVEQLVAGIKGMAAGKRFSQTKVLKRVVELDYELGRSYLLGLERGLRLLQKADLESFVETALAGVNQGERRRRFLALEASAARELHRRQQTMATLTAQIPELQRYLRARGGRALAVRSLSEIPPSPVDRPAAVCTDGVTIYLPAEMEAGRDLAANQNLYRLLAGLELAWLEAGSFAFDCGRWQRLHGPRPTQHEIPPAFACSDYYAFFALFPVPALAEKLFNLAEFVRVRAFLRRLYPGFARRAAALLTPVAEETAALTQAAALSAELERQADALHQPEALVEASADWVAAVYDQVAARPEGVAELLAFSFPWQRGLRFDLVYLARAATEKKAAAWCRRLAEQGVGVDKTTIREILADEKQILTPELLRRRLEQSGALYDHGGGRLLKLPPGVRLNELLPPNPAATLAGGRDEPLPTFWYDEWDYRLNDYLRHRVKLLEHRRVGGDEFFYAATIADSGGLIRRIRRNFELLRPETMQILRRWPEGEAFDYDALLEYALDRRRRLTPSERLYRKRLKVERDVAVFVLVDLSSSTRKAVLDGGGKTVLAVEKEALVLFCEALEKVGDRYALAGFSGSGRLAAEFFYLKDFTETLGPEVKGRIGGVRPEKNTRMGPAIRHAAQALKSCPARVKLMIILSDGLPNDQDYSHEYAIADSRSAIRESRAAFIHVHAITVNAVNSPHLDNLYGDVHHTVIADVRQLPDKLPRIYRALTRP
ncbi:MAG TPA: VWA domain-containing protein [Proteobacteria bacterium]|nr:VWA domain-containing protein [Pseudomonadota bacterium]